jgi:KaiC domain protein
MSEDDRDDDWFESAFEDDASADGEDDTEETTSEPSTDEDAENSDAFGAGATDSQDPLDATDTEEPFDADEADDAFGGDATDDAFGGDATDDAFGGDATDDAFDGDAADTGDSFDGDTDDPFSDGEDSGGSLFDDDFGSAMASAGPGGGDGGGGSGDFDEEDFESEIPRIDLGITGLDKMIQGGIPQRHLMVTIGSPGTGKTTFGLQFLHHGLQKGDSGVFITLEQSRQAIIDTANERGWEFDRYEQEDKLAIVDLDPVEMANSLDNIRGELPQLIREFDAERLVLDSVSLLEMMYDDQSKRRTEVFDFTRSLKDAGVTTMLTSEADDENPYTSRHGIIEYLTDAVFILQYVRGDTSETRLAVEIQKIRNANHSRATKPYEITLDGIDVYDQASIF